MTTPQPPGGLAGLVHGTDGPRRRKRFHRFLGWAGGAVVLIVGSLVALLIDTAAGTPTGATTDERAVSYRTEQLRADGSPDAAFAVVRGGRIATSGTLGGGVSTDTPFAVGSLSKSFTALAVMQLVDGGTVGLDDPVTRYIPWFRTADPAAVITVRQLLTQTSGLPTWAGTVDLSAPQTTLEQRVRAIAEVRPVTTPGAAFHYCNKNYATLGLLVEKVTHLPYADYLQQHILNPLDMHRTFTDRGAARRAGMIDGSAIWFGAHVRQSAVDFPGALADGNLVSTVGDLSHYLQALQTGSYHGRRIISERSLQLMHTGVVDDDLGSRYAFGWRVSKVNGHRVIAHEGDLSNFHANLGIVPGTGTGLIVLTAHNSKLFDPALPYAGALHILAGGTTPTIDRSYLIVELMVNAAAVIILLLLTAGTVGLVRRGRKLPGRTAGPGWPRAVVLPALCYLLGSGAIAALVYCRLGVALRDDVVLTPAVLFAAVPDLTMMLAAIICWLALAGMVLLVAGAARRKSRAADPLKLANPVAS